MSADRINAKDLLTEVRRYLRLELPPALAALSLPALETTAIFVGPPTLLPDEAASWPRCCIMGHFTARQLGTTIEPLFHLIATVAFKWTGNEDGFMDGMEMASVMENLFRGYSDNPPYWEDVVVSGLAIRPVYSTDDGWQGGETQITLACPTRRYS